MARLPYDFTRDFCTCFYRCRQPTDRSRLPCCCSSSSSSSAAAAAAAAAAAVAGTPPSCFPRSWRFQAWHCHPFLCPSCPLPLRKPKPAVDMSTTACPGASSPSSRSISFFCVALLLPNAQTSPLLLFCVCPSASPALAIRCAIPQTLCSVFPCELPCFCPCTVRNPMSMLCSLNSSHKNQIQ
jgi:hypothetical protein